MNIYAEFDKQTRDFLNGAEFAAAKAALAAKGYTLSVVGSPRVIKGTREHWGFCIRNGATRTHALRHIGWDRVRAYLAEA